MAYLGWEWRSCSILGGGKGGGGESLNAVVCLMIVIKNKKKGGGGDAGEDRGFFYLLSWEVAVKLLFHDGKYDTWRRWWGGGDTAFCFLT